MAKKTAKMHIAVVEFTCPTCDEHISNEKGSHMFELHEIPTELTCDHCDEVLKVLAKATKLRSN